MDFSSVCMVVWLCSRVLAVSECKEFSSSFDLYLGLNLLHRKCPAEVIASYKVRIRNLLFLTEQSREWNTSNSFLKYL